MNCPAFLVSLPLSRPHHSPLRSSTSARPSTDRCFPMPKMTSTNNELQRRKNDIKITTQYKKAPPIIPQHVSVHPLLLSLYKTFQKQTPSPTFASLLSPSMSWESPLFLLSSSAEALGTLSSFLSFAEDPSIVIPTSTFSESCLSFTWTVSFTWPLPWRPRIAFSGNAAVKFNDEGYVDSWVDTWLCGPGTLLKQTLPTMTDIVWLWPTPHAENDAGMREVVERRRGYTLMKLASRMEFRVEGRVSEEEMERVWQAPCLPGDVFTGGLRRKERYSVVTPISVREIGDGKYEWAVNVPGTLVGSCEVGVAPAGGEGRFVEVGERVVAVVGYWGEAVGEGVRKRADKVLKELEKDGKKGGLWWGRSFDSRVGFNGKGMLAMATFGSAVLVPKRNEIVVEIEGS